MIAEQLVNADKLARHLKHTFPITADRARRANAEAAKLSQEAEILRDTLDDVRRIQSDLMLRLLTCGLSHRRVMRIIRNIKR